jgi:cytochrome c biogenesis protein CcdA/thiol-disulfide isomerase/thioredoxin
MLILLFIAFVSGLVTILAPCIWPLLPIILSSSVGGGKGKAFGITLGIMASFAFFTLTISSLVMLFHFDPNVLRLLAVVVIGFLGLTLAVPALSLRLEALVSRFTGKLGGRFAERGGFLGGLVTGIALGVVWTPCAGPILATIATLAATSAVNFQIVLVTLVYVLGVGIPLFFFALGGSWFFAKSRFVNKFTGRIQQVFGIIMILTALAIYTNYDKVLQAKLLDVFPSYTNFIIKLENTGGVQEQLDILRGRETSRTDTSTVPSNLNDYGEMPDFAGIEKWLNSEPLRIADLKGKVVLVDFWTYTCINCIRTLPYVTSWYEKYKDKGFVVVGVHTPEFEFEKKTENVQSAISQYKINYPVAQDNNYETWNAYNNRYWPAKYLIDTKGHLRKFHFGEGKYEEMEMAIQELLTEAGNAAQADLSSFEGDKPTRLQTPETYLGLLRMERFGSREDPAIGSKVYTTSGSLPRHYFAYQGRWSIQNEYSKASQGAVLEINFFANKVYLVTTPDGQMGRIRVFLDGKAVGENNQGADVENGTVEVGKSNLFNLIDLGGNPSEHILRLEFETDGVQVYAFTFG